MRTLFSKRWLLAVCLALALCARVPAQSTIDTTNFIVLGEGLAAGMADFGLRDTYQAKCFPALMATQMKTAFPMPLIEAPGIGSVPGFPTQDITVPARGQSTVRETFPPDLFVFNLSVPGLKVADAINRRPTIPLVQKNDQLQTNINLILGYPALIVKDAALWSQLEYAQFMRPTLVVIELGYFDVLDAAVKGDVTLLPDVAAFRASYSQILTAMNGTFATVVVTTIPDPMDTAYFTSLPSATRLIGAPAGTLAQLYKLQPDDLLTVTGLVAVGNQIAAKSIGTLPPGSVISGAVAAQVRARVRAMNGEITSLAQQSGATLYDLNAFFAGVRSQGVTVGTRTLTADFGGGFYTLNGFYPGITAHGLIANQILTLLNKTGGASFPLVDVVALLGSDPAAKTLMYKGRREYTLEEMTRQ